MKMIAHTRARAETYIHLTVANRCAAIDYKYQTRLPDELSDNGRFDCVYNAPLHVAIATKSIWILIFLSFLLRIEMKSKITQNTISFIHLFHQ